MTTEVLERRFAAIGARVAISGPPLGAPAVDIRNDDAGEFFDIRFARGTTTVELEVIDVRPADRHLLLLVREPDEKSKFLCGHDERHWFVAAIPEDARGVTGVATAKAALQPPLVQQAIGRARPKHPFRRRNAAYVRQGEWFFVPAPGVKPPWGSVLRDEPLSRGRGKSHVMQYAHRTGGTLVWVNRQHPSGIGEDRFRRLTEAERKGGGWTALRRDPEVYAKGTIRHPDHATVTLADWHRVAMNTEQRARAMRHVVFLD